MTISKLLKITIGLLICFAIIIGLTSIKHPIILKWLAGSARIIGKPIGATVYTNGKAGNNIKVYKVDKYWDNKPNTSKRANTYLLNLKEFDKEGKLKFININLDEGWIGIPIGLAKKDYDYILGYLFQSEVGGHFADFRDDIKGYSFDPNLVFDKNQIKFSVPPNKLKFDSIEINFD